MADMKTLLSLHWILLSAAAAMIAVLLPLYLNSAGLPESQIGTIFGLGALISIAASILLFTHSDVRGRKFYLILFGILMASSSLIAASFPPVFIFGLLAATLYTASKRSPWIFGKILAIEEFDLKMGQSYGIFGASLIAGGAIGSLLAGAMADSMGFKTTFLICSLIGLISILPIAKLKGLRATRPKSSMMPKFTRAYTGLILHRFVYSTGFSSIIIIAIPLYLRNELMLSYVLVGAAIMAKNVGGALGFSSGRISDRYDFRSICCLGMPIAGFLFLSVGFLKDLISVCLALFLAELVHGVAATGLPYFYERVSTQLGRDISIIESIGATLGLSLGPWLSGLIIPSAGYPAVFILGGSMIAGSSLFLYASLGRRA